MFYCLRFTGGRSIRQVMSATTGCCAAAVCGPSTSPAWPSSLWSGTRAVASYPTPRSGVRARRNKKQYNYLTSERLVKTPRRRMDRQSIRHRDDRALAQRRSYREELLRDVEEKIRFMSPEVKDFIFFPQTRTRAIRLVFKGNRVPPTRTFTRIHFDIIDRLVTKQNRGNLIRIMKEAGIEPPSAEAFRKYSDPKTGTITVPLTHSPWIERYFRELGRKYVTACSNPRTSDGKVDTTTFSMSVQQAYILLHFDDESKVPSLASWSHSLGPLDPQTELIENGHRHETLSTMLVQSRREVLAWGQQQLTNALSPLSMEEQQAIVEEALEKFEPQMKKLASQLEFAAKVMLAINSLPEVKAMRTPSRVFTDEKELETIIKQRGVAFPPSPYSLKDWRALSKEEQQQYYCFKKKAETRASSGQQLFMRYCTRDYGISRHDVPKYYARLTDEQQAALNFPFYYPITPRSATAVAFKKYYQEMCERYGLVRTNHNMSHGNRLFEAAMRQRWRKMPETERLRYYSDSILSAFPLHPKDDGAAPPADSAPAARGTQQQKQQEEEEEEEELAKVLSAEPVPKTAAHDVLRLANKAQKLVAPSQRRRGGKNTPATKQQRKKRKKSVPAAASRAHHHDRQTSNRKRHPRRHSPAAGQKGGALFVYSAPRPAAAVPARKGKKSSSAVSSSAKNASGAMVFVV